MGTLARAESATSAAKHLRKDVLASAAATLMSNAIRSTALAPQATKISQLEEDAHSFDAPPSSTSINNNAAELSRAAAQTVRMSLEQGSSREAFLIVKSLQASVRHYSRRREPDPIALQKVPIDFGQAVNPRLSMHCLVHGLIRNGMTKKAGDLVSDMRRMRLRVHGETLRIVTSSLLATDASALRDASHRDRIQQARGASQTGQGLVPSTKPPRLTWSGVQNPCTRLALQLFVTARQYRRQRNKEMFQQLIDACLLQGEIIVFSFLFAFLVKQWQLRMTLTDEVREKSKNTPNMLDGIDTVFMGDKEQLKWIKQAKGTSVPFPSPKFLHKALIIIDASVNNTPLAEPSAIRPTFEEATQALAIIAGMLQEQILPFGCLSKLISILTAFPSDPRVVIWTRKDGRWMKRNARKYFDEVLNSVATSIAFIDSKETAKPKKNRRKVQFTLDQRSYNSLLHYALRYRLSPALGNAILARMIAQGEDIAPNISTFNILMRSGTLLRRQDMALKSLALLRERPENLENSILMRSSGLDPIPREISNERRRTGLVKSQVLDTILSLRQGLLRNISSRPKREQSIGKLITTIGNEEISSVPGKLPDEPSIKADDYTVASCIALLNAIGHPSLVANILFLILPELHVIDHPATSPVMASQPPGDKKLDRNECLKRAITLGPHIFVALLNALVNAGKTGLAERVWILAKEAEALSFNLAFTEGQPDLQSWCLPIEAYTIMMQCYAGEGRRGLRLHARASKLNRADQRLVAWHSDQEWTPKGNDNVRGWAYFLLLKKQALALNRKDSGKCHPVVRRDAARQTGLALFQAMRTGGLRVFEQLNFLLATRRDANSNIGLPKLRNMRPPIPDARFFNAALDLFGRTPDPHARPVHTKPSHAKRLARRKFDRFMRDGQAPPQNDPVLSEIIRAMHESEVEIPVGFKHLLIGEWVEPRQNASKPGRVWLSPYPRRTHFSPHKLPILRTRGLPVRRPHMKERTESRAIEQPQST